VNKTFRYTRSRFTATIVATAIFLALFGIAAGVMISSRPFFAEDADCLCRTSALLVSLSVLGGIALVCMYALASAYWCRLSIDDSLISIRSLFQRRQFGVSDIQRLRWRALDWRIEIHAFNRKSLLGLANFSREDRLEIIRFFRRVVPAERQEGWPVYCHRVAIRLHDGANYVPAKPVEPPEGVLFITRRRYDWMAVTLIPLTVAIAIFAWWQFGSRQLFSLLPVVIIWFLILRTSVPPQGMRVSSGDVVSRSLVFVLLGWFVLIIGCLLAWELLPLTRATGNIFVLACAIASAVPFVAILRHSAANQKRRSQRDEFAAPSAVEQWERGELEEVSSASR
jgi:hypothetical protein